MVVCVSNSESNEERFMLNLRVERRNQTAVVHGSGRIDMGDSLTRLREALITQMGAREILLDLSQVTAIDAAGLGLLVFLHTRAAGRGCMLKLLAPSSQVSRVLAVTHLDSVLPIVSTVEARQLERPLHESLTERAVCA